MMVEEISNSGKFKCRQDGLEVLTALSPFSEVLSAESLWAA
jgi:hypothetical protein